MKLADSGNDPGKIKLAGSITSVPAPYDVRHDDHDHHRRVFRGLYPDPELSRSLTMMPSPTAALDF
jgi:hypothetical protein